MKLEHQSTTFTEWQLQLDQEKLALAHKEQIKEELYLPVKRFCLLRAMELPFFLVHLHAPSNGALIRVLVPFTSTQRKSIEALSGRVGAAKSKKRPLVQFHHLNSVSELSKLGAFSHFESNVYSNLDVVTFANSVFNIEVLPIIYHHWGRHKSKYSETGSWDEEFSEYCLQVWSALKPEQQQCYASEDEFIEVLSGTDSVTDHKINAIAQHERLAFNVLTSVRTLQKAAKLTNDELVTLASYFTRRPELGVFFEAQRNASLHSANDVLTMHHSIAPIIAKITSTTNLTIRDVGWLLRVGQAIPGKLSDIYTKMLQTVPTVEARSEANDDGGAEETYKQLVLNVLRGKDTLLMEKYAYLANFDARDLFRRGLLATPTRALHEVSSPENLLLRTSPSHRQQVREFKKEAWLYTLSHVFSVDEAVNLQQLPLIDLFRLHRVLTCPDVIKMVPFATYGDDWKKKIKSDPVTLQRELIEQQFVGCNSPRLELTYPCGTLNSKIYAEIVRRILNGDGELSEVNSLNDIQVLAERAGVRIIGMELYRQFAALTYQERLSEHKSRLSPDQYETLLATIAYWQLELAQSVTKMLPATKIPVFPYPLEIVAGMGRDKVTNLEFLPYIIQNYISYMLNMGDILIDRNKENYSEFLTQVERLDGYVTECMKLTTINLAQDSNIKLAEKILAYQDKDKKTLENERLSRLIQVALQKLSLEAGMQLRELIKPFLITATSNDSSNWFDKQQPGLIIVNEQDESGKGVKIKDKLLLIQMKLDLQKTTAQVIPISFWEKALNILDQYILLKLREVQRP